MVTFPITRTRHLTFQLKELTIAEAAALAGMNAGEEQAECTAFLRAALKEVAQGEQNPADWTVEERILAVCQYLAGTAADGPDFSIGAGHYSDYLRGADHDVPPLTPLGELVGDSWSIRPLTGRYAESIERLQGEVRDEAGRLLPTRLHWTVGVMAASLVRAEEELPGAGATDADIDAWMQGRIAVFSAFAETDFAALLTLFFEGRKKIEHLFAIQFGAEGILVAPKEGAEDLPPARFPVRSCLSEFAQAMG